MFTKKRTLILLVTILVLAFVAAGCGGSDTPPPTPTRTPKPTFTPTPEGQVVNAPLFEESATPGNDGDTVAEAPTNTPTPEPQQPTDTPIPTQEPPTPTPTPQPPQISVSQVVNVRSGPSTAYRVIGQAQPGQKYPITGKNAKGDWWQINFNGKPGWIVDRLVAKEGQLDTVQVVANIPPPPPTSTPRPRPTATPIPAPTQPPKPSYPYSLVQGSWRCDPNAGTTYFNGFVKDRAGNMLNGVCVHIAYYGPRKTKCSGCDGVGNGNWGFSPFGGPAPPGTPVEIYVVPCPPNMPLGGQSSNFGDLTPQSDKWTMTINESVQCTGITFVKN
jgi:hypothetical protein